MDMIPAGRLRKRILIRATISAGWSSREESLSVRIDTTGWAVELSISALRGAHSLSPRK